jgi:HTH-type transcriptional regulator/antitoxin HigA
MDDLTPELERHFYECVLKRIEALMDAKPGTKEGAELDFLTTVAGSYEERHFPMASEKKDAENG